MRPFVIARWLAADLHTQVRSVGLVQVGAGSGHTLAVGTRDGGAC